MPLALKRARKSTPTSPLTRGLAVALAAGLAAGLSVITAASPATAASTSYTSGSFTVGDSGPSTPYPVTVSVPTGPGKLKSLSLTLINPQHNHPGDMTFTLRSPSGTTVEIGCNDGNTSFSDASTCNPLTPFYGTDPAGTWELLANDTVSAGDDPDTSYGGFTLTLDAGTTPVITATPADTTTTSGTPVTLTSAATGDPTPSVQWQVDSGTGFVNLPGASTSASYSFIPVFADSGNNYRVRYSNASGTAISMPAALTVLPLAASITVDPSDTTVDSGSTATFLSDATGDPVPTVQWERAEPGSMAFSSVPGATGKSLSLTAAFADDGARYRAVYTNSAGSLSTTPATLTVALLAPSVTQNPSDAAVASGDEVSLVAGAASEVPETVQWQRAAPGQPFLDIPGATSTTLTFPAAAALDGYRFQAVFTNPAGSATTTTSTLAVSPDGARATSDPADATVLAGATATFTASASGDPIPTVQWRLSTDGGVTFADIDGATHETYAFTAAAGDDGNQYVAVFTNAGGTETTNAAILTVNVVPVVTLPPADQTVAVNTRATFASGASGQPAPSVRWQVSTDGDATFSDIAGATDPVLTVLAEKTTNGNRYRAVYTNAGGQTSTTSATLTVLTPVPVTAPSAPPVTTPATLPVTGTSTAPLAVTGTESWILAVASALMVTAGSALVVTRRRKRTAS